MDYPYTAIFGRGLINKFKAIIKQSYLCMKMPSPLGVIVVHGDQTTAWQIEGKLIPRYSMINEVKKNHKEEQEENKEKQSPKAEPGEDTQKVPLTEKCPERCVHLGTGLSPYERNELVEFLNKNGDVFAWSAKDLQGVNRSLAQHSLNVVKGSRPKKAKAEKNVRRVRESSKSRSAKVARCRSYQAGAIP
jgi:hypothetical protein